MHYDGSPTRPQAINKQDREANDVEIDDNTRLVISLDILHDHDEELLRLIQVATPTGVGQQRKCYILITSMATYILRKGEEKCDTLVESGHVTMVCFRWNRGCLLA